jgi:hypothetical protein
MVSPSTTAMTRALRSSYGGGAAKAGVRARDKNKTDKTVLIRIIDLTSKSLAQLDAQLHAVMIVAAARAWSCRGWACSDDHF